MFAIGQLLGYSVGDYAFANGNFPVSTREPEALASFEVFPNPSSDKLFVQGELEHSRDLNLRLVDALGRVISQKEIF